ncbi:glycosyltransferase [Bradyrhizobium tunisiense]|uniref:glycosyltransferase n=1 Tax=Bradyrhizobium tunisiense TaxID=3278709 RepID=UPI0035E096C6
MHDAVDPKGIQAMSHHLDIVIPVYNEGANILGTLRALARQVETPARVLICYDFEEDNTLLALRDQPDAHTGLDIAFVRNPSRGAHAAVIAGFAASTAPIVVMYPADDHVNAGILDRMVGLVNNGYDVVCASRFLPGGTMQGCPWLKAMLVWAAAFTLHHLAALPTRDPTNGFRMFSRRVIDQIKIESHQGFCYSIELLVKVHRLGWRVSEVPALWFERRHGASRFRVLKWLPAYLHWFWYAFATTYLRQSPETVLMQSKPAQTAEHVSEEWPKVICRDIQPVSPWMELIAREVEFSPGQAEIYHAVNQQDYLAIVAVTPSGHFPIVHQYRPALESFSWELPAGLAEPGENVADGCRRELHEETGYLTREIQPLGVASPCTGRLSNRIHSFFVQTGERDADVSSEPSISVKLVTAGELVEMIKSGEFASQLHLGSLLLAELRSFITLR